MADVKKKAPPRVSEMGAPPEKETLQVIEGGQEEEKIPEPFLVFVREDDTVGACVLGSEDAKDSRVIMSVEATSARIALNKAAKIDTHIDTKTKTYAA